MRVRTPRATRVTTASAQRNSFVAAEPQAQRVDRRALAAFLDFEAKLACIAGTVRLLPSLTARNAVAERARLETDLRAGTMPCPRYDYAPPKPSRANLRWLDQLRVEASRLPVPQLYLDKLEELELDVALLAGLGDVRQVRPLAARRFGTGEELVDTPSGRLRLIDYSIGLLKQPWLSDRQTLRRRRARAVVPADGPAGTFSLRALIEYIAKVAKLQVQVRVEPNLTAGAATGDRTVFIADRKWTPREAWRLAVHEVLGHLTAAQNGKQQPLRLLEWGCGFAFADQEGVALCIEESFGVLDRARLRALAGRVLATRQMHAGAAFGETARCLFNEFHFDAPEAIAITERAYRGGGVARDAGYLKGHLRVRQALQDQHTTLQEMRMGRVSLSALPALRELQEIGVLNPPVYRPNLTRSFFSTNSGTMPWRLPPSAAASLMSVELT